MNKKIIYKILLLGLFLLFLTAVIPTKHNIVYYPKVLDKSTTLSLEISTYNLFGFVIPYKTKKIEFCYNENESDLEIINNQNSLICEIEKEKKSFLIQIKEDKKKYLISLPIIHIDNDSDDDGFPDAMELDDESDRYNFRKWFCTIALTQFYHKDDRWQDRDCAGLIRYCTREALKVHNNKWFSEKKLLYDINIPDIKKYNYPVIPVTGSKLFRITDERFQQDSIFVNRNFSEFAEARFLLSYNYEFISKDVREALPGDILFFANDQSIEWPYHSMIFLGSDIIFEKSIGDFVVYHTGSDDGKQGIIKKIRLSELNKHPNKRWHAITSNQYFLGFYRWKLLK